MALKIKNYLQKAIKLCGISEEQMALTHMDPLRH